MPRDPKSGLVYGRIAGVGTAAVYGPGRVKRDALNKVKLVAITAAIAAALSTDGDGRTNPINAIKKIEVTKSRALTFLMGNRINQSRNELMIAKFASETALKCVNPDLRIASLNSTLCKEVSPNTIPGIIGSLFVASLKPLRIFPSFCCHHVALPSPFSNLRSIGPVRGG